MKTKTLRSLVLAVILLSHLGLSVLSVSKSTSAFTESQYRTPEAVLIADGPEEVPPAVQIADGPEEVPPTAVLIADGPEEVPPAVQIADGPEEVPPAILQIA